MIRKVLHWLWSCCIILTLAACGGSSDNSAPIVKAKTTLLVYLVASDVTSTAERMLAQMANAQVNSDVNVVLQIGGGDDTGSIDTIDMTQARRYRLIPDTETQGKTWDIEALPEGQQPAQVAMNTPEALRDFLKWGAAQYPAEQYAVALFDHAGGPVHGYGRDLALGGGKTMSLPAIKSAFQQADVHFELIGFDACLMGNLEVASNLAPYANFLVGSEEVTTGWDWTGTLNYLAANPSAKGNAFGKAIVEAYAASATRTDFTAYSVISLGQVPRLVAILDKISTTLSSAINGSDPLNAWIQISQARRSAQDFQSNLFSTQYDLVDAKSWVIQLSKAQLISSAVAAEFYNAHQATISYVDGSDDDATGLSLYFPRFSTLNEQILSIYSGLDFSPNYQALVRTFTAFAAGEQMPDIELGDTTAEGNAVVANIQVSSGKLPATVVRPYDQAYAILMEGTVAVSMQSASGIRSQIKLEQANVWPVLNSQLVSLLPDDEADGIFAIPVFKDGTQGTLIAAREVDGRVLIKWFVADHEISGAAATMLQVKPRDVFAPMYFDLLQENFTVGSARLVVPEGDWEVKMTTLPRGSYTIHMAVSTLSGVVTTSSHGMTLP